MRGRLWVITFPAISPYLFRLITTTAILSQTHNALIAGKLLHSSFWAVAHQGPPLLHVSVDFDYGTWDLLGNFPPHK